MAKRTKTTFHINPDRFALFILVALLAASVFVLVRQYGVGPADVGEPQEVLTR